ncbi:MAG TPA: TonB-dependent receptor, partial [Haliscomenobacter sp.]|uniref:TonB-dependent receptor plug domain-containing protein n=1 Tax=Haliscomenobacter sp. TaxID=2717303 RepID=UPI002BAF8138
MKKPVLLLTLVMVFCSSLLGQSSIQVKVSSLLEDLPIADKWIYLNSDSGQQLVDSARTDARGMAIFVGLTVGKSYFIYSLDDKVYQAAMLSDIKAKEGELDVNFNLPNQRTASIGEILISSTSLVRMNTENAAVSGQLKKDELQRLPIEGRDVTRSLFRLPNVTVAILGYAEGPNISINGLNGIFTNYLIDGLDNNERFLGNMKFNTPVGFVENITVLTNNYSAEWGNTSNGIVNVLSRSGTNDWTGEAFYLTRPGSIVDAPSSFATLDLYGNPVKDGFQRHQIGAALGGPITKDKTFFYFNLEQTYDFKDNLLNVAQLGVNEIVQGRNNFTYGSAKVDHIWSPNLRTSVRGQIGRFYNQRQGGGLEGGILFPSASSAQDNDTYLFAVKNQYKIGSKISGELNYQHSYFRWNYRQPVNETTPSVTVQNPAGTAIAIVGQSGAIFDDLEYTHQVQNKWVYRQGKHLFKAGLEWITSDFQLLGGGNPYGTYTVRLTDQQLTDLRNLGKGANLNVQDLPTNVNVRTYDVELRPTSFGAVQNVFSAYLEDQWSLNRRLNISLGLRWDYDDLSKAGGTQGDFNNLGPRTSFNYKLDQRSVIRGGYGIYYDKIKYSVYSDNLQFSSNAEDFKKQLGMLQQLGLLSPDADLNRVTFPGNIRATAANVAFLQGPNFEELQARREEQFSNNLRIMNPNGFQNPYSHQ